MRNAKQRAGRAPIPTGATVVRPPPPRAGWLRRDKGGEPRRLRGGGARNLQGDFSLAAAPPRFQVCAGLARFRAGRDGIGGRRGARHTYCVRGCRVAGDAAATAAPCCARCVRRAWFQPWFTAPANGARPRRQFCVITRSRHAVPQLRCVLHVWVSRQAPRCRPAAAAAPAAATRARRGWARRVKRHHQCGGGAWARASGGRGATPTHQRPTPMCTHPHLRPHPRR